MKILFKSHLKRGRSGLILVVIFVCLAVVLMTSGLSILFKSNSFYADKITELGGPNSIIYNHVSNLAADEINDMYMSKLSELDYVEAFYKTNCVELNEDMTLELGNKDIYNGMRFYNKDSKETPYELKVVESCDGEGIPLYLSTFEKIKNHRKLGEKLVLTVKGAKYPAYIAGFFEHILYLYNSSFVYTDDASMKILDELKFDDKFWVLAKPINYEVYLKEFTFESTNMLRLDMARISNEVRNEYIKIHDLPPQAAKMLAVQSVYADLNDVIPSSEPYIKLMAVLLIVFSIIITLVSLLIMRFLIKTGIEDDIKNIGINKALGYTTKELRLSYIAVFGMLLGIGSVVGIIIAICFMPLFSQIITILANLYLVVKPNVLACFLALVLTLSVCMLTTFLSTKKLSAITPLNAIRSSEIVKKQKKNYVPLEKTHMGINLALSIKSIANSRTQSVMIFLIVLMLTFLCAFSSVCFYNMSVNKTVMLNLSGRELYDVGLYIEEDVPTKKVNALIEKLEQSDLIDESLKSIDRHIEGLVDNNYSMTFSMALDYNKIRTDTLYEGSYPTDVSQVTLPGIFAKNINKKVGDSIELKTNEINKTCTIVGLTQSLYANDTVQISKELYAIFYPELDMEMYSYNERLIYLKNPKDIKQYVDWATKIIEEEKIDGFVYDNRTQTEESVLSMIKPASTLLMSIVLGVTIIVVATVIFMIIRMKLLREKRNIAINKALGFSSFMIMNQLGLSILIVTAFGAVLGAVLGGVLSPLMISAMGKFIGLMKLSFKTNYFFVFGITAAILVATYIISSLVTISTRRITPKVLVGK